MKIISSTFLMLICLTIFSLVIDTFQGFTIDQALYNAISPFRVMSIGEIFTLWFLVFLCPIILFFIEGQTKKEVSTL